MLKPFKRPLQKLCILFVYLPLYKKYTPVVYFLYIFHHDLSTSWSILFVYSKYTLSGHNFGKINRSEGIQKVYTMKYTKSIQNTELSLQKKKVYFLYTNLNKQTIRYTKSIQNTKLSFQKKKVYTFCIQT